MTRLACPRRCPLTRIMCNFFLLPSQRDVRCLYLQHRGETPPTRVIAPLLFLLLFGQSPQSPASSPQNRGLRLRR